MSIVGNEIGRTTDFLKYLRFLKERFFGEFVTTDTTAHLDGRHVNPDARDPWREHGRWH